MQEAGLIMIGSPEEVEKRIGKLRKSIGIIAREAAQKGHNSAYLRIDDTIDRVAQTLPEAIAQTPDMLNVVAKIALPFGEETNDDGCEVVFKANHLWNPRVDPYMYIDQSHEGLRDRSPYQTAYVNVDRAQSVLFRYLSMRDQTSARTLIDNALELYLSSRLKDPALVSDIRAEIDFSDNYPEPSEEVKQRQAELRAILDQLDGDA